MSRLITTNLSVRHRAKSDEGDGGGGNISPMRYRYRSDDIDLDATLELLAGTPFPDETDIVVRERIRSRRAAVLIIDVSGSMKGEKARMAAATIAALSNAFRDDDFAVVAFWSDAAVLKPLREPMSAATMLDVLLRVPTRGLTNIQFGLTVADAELRTSAIRRRTAILLTDALHNAGPDPREVAGRFGELHVLLQTDGSHDRPLAADIARLGHGHLAEVQTYRDIAPALNAFLSLD
nr:VWA domain-containing protein [Rhodococcus sp. (in: high G+C Gram-positive bacteria)]